VRPTLPPGKCRSYLPWHPAGPDPGREVPIIATIGILPPSSRLCRITRTQAPMQPFVVVAGKPRVVSLSPPPACAGR